jgi:hypothetical protein
MVSKRRQRSRLLWRQALGEIRQTWLDLLSKAAAAGDQRGSEGVARRDIPVFKAKRATYARTETFSKWTLAA